MATFHEPKASEMSCDISHANNVTSDYAICMLTMFSYEIQHLNMGIYSMTCFSKYCISSKFVKAYQCYIKMENSSPGNKILKLCLVEIILDEHTDTKESSKANNYCNPIKINL